MQRRMRRFECHHGGNEGVLWLAQRDLRAHGVFDEGGEAFAFLQDVFSRLAQAG